MSQFGSFFVVGLLGGLALFVATIGLAALRRGPLDQAVLHGLVALIVLASLGWLAERVALAGFRAPMSDPFEEPDPLSRLAHDRRGESLAAGAPHDTRGEGR